MHYQSLSEIKSLTIQQNLYLQEILELKKDFLALQHQNSLLLEELNEVKAKNQAIYSKVDGLYDAILVSILFHAAIYVLNVVFPTGFNALGGAIFKSQQWQSKELREQSKKLEDIVTAMEDLGIEVGKSEMVAAALDVIDKSI